MTIHTRSALALALGLTPLATTAPALVLTFDPAPGDFARVDQAYGDRVVTTPQDGFAYGTEGGFTPNVVVDYGPLPDALPSLWTTGYGDLVNVLYEDQDGFGRLEITLTADPGWWVSLAAFDLAAWRPRDPIAGVSVRSGSGDLLFEDADVVVTSTGHEAYRFDPPLVGQSLVITLDTSNLGTFSDDVAIDNITFAQMPVVVPIERVSWGELKARHR